MNRTSSNRLAVAVLACGVALAALPLASVLAETPQPPAAPASPEAPRIEKRVVIIDRNGSEDAGEDGDLHTRVISRDGKTFVFKTTEAMSDAEVERRIAEAETAIPAVPALPPVPAMDGQRVEKRMIIRHGGAGAGEDVDVVTRECAAHPVTDVEASAEKDGKRTRVKIRVCDDDPERMADALQAVRKARDGIAADASIPGEVRAEILGELDSEIARLEKSPG